MLKKVLSKVLNLEIADVDFGIPKNIKKDNYIFYRVKDDFENLYKINKYEFMYLCKQYIYSLGYWLSLRTNYNSSYLDIFLEKSDKKYPIIASLSAEEEFSIIIKATNFVIEDIDNKM